MKQKLDPSSVDGVSFARLKNHKLLTAQRCSEWDVGSRVLHPRQR